MAATTVWGVDIGNSAIKAVKMIRVGGECKIVDFDIVDIPGSEDDKDRSSRVHVALKNLLVSRKFGNDAVYVSVQGNICIHREFVLPPGSEAKVRELVGYEAKQQIPLPLEQVEWGFERYEDPSGIGIALIAVRKSDIQDIINLKVDHKINLRGITAAPVALFNYTAYEFNPNTTTLILDAGAKGTDFVVMNKRQLYFRTIQIAGREITRVLENKFKVPFEKAEDLKKNIAQSPQMDKILSVIEPTLRQLGAEVQRTIGFYKTKAPKGVKIAQCYLLGHTFRLPKMAEYLQMQVREAPFAIVEGLQRVQIGPVPNPQIWENEFPTMAVAIGLGIQGLGLSELKLNLVPAEEEAADTMKKFKPWIAASAAVFIGALGVSYVQADSFKARMEEKADEVRKIKTQVDGVKKDEEKIISAFAGKERLLERLARPGRDRGKITQIVNKILALRSPEGQAMFGPANKVYLTKLYASRQPVTERTGAETDNNDNRVIKDRSGQKVGIDRAESLTGKNSLYGPLGVSPVDPLTLPTELRPQAPLVVVLSGEFEGDTTEARKVSALVDKIKEMPEVKDKQVFTEILESAGVTEKIPTFTFQDGKQKEGVTFEERKVPMVSFHLIFRWNEPEDPDLEPSTTPPPAPAKK